MTSEGLGDMFEGDSADMCAGKFPTIFLLLSFYHCAVKLNNQHYSTVFIADIPFSFDCREIFSEQIPTVSWKRDVGYKNHIKAWWQSDFFVLLWFILMSFNTIFGLYFCPVLQLSMVCTAFIVKQSTCLYPLSCFTVICGLYCCAF